MIISFKHKFIFVKNYKTAGSSIETYLYNFLDSQDITAQTKEHKGINFQGNFDPQSLIENFEKETVMKYINNKMAFFAHMPLWLIKERLELLSEKIKINFFDDFYKFAVIRNPFDLIVSDYLWNNNKENHLRNNFKFDEIINEIQTNNFSTFRLFNFNKISTKNTKDILCDSVISFENLNEDLSKVFSFLNIPFNKKLNIFKKVSSNKRNYKEYYSKDSKKIVEKFFQKEIEYFNYKF